MKRLMLWVVAAACVASLFGRAQAQRRGSAVVCGDPTAQCRTIPDAFQPYDLQFRLRTNTVIWESEPFYAVVLRSVRVADDWGDCDKFVPESDRVEAQRLFPRNKVFASRCGEPGTLYYTNTAPKQRFMAVDAGRTRAEAERLLAQVRATGKYPSANLRRMRAGFNGT